MKKLLALTLALVGLSTQAATFSTNSTGSTVYLLTTNRASVYQIELTSSTNVTVDLYDSDNLSAPYYGTNYVAGAYSNRVSYATNYVTSYIGSNGYTNYYTNAGIWSTSSQVAAATNALPSMGSFVVAGGTYAIYNVDILFTRGIAVKPNNNVSITVNYRTGQ